jgi:hypothetical protein
VQLTVRLLGVEVLHINLAESDEATTQATDCTTYPVGFVVQPGDQRWDKAIQEG